MTIARHSAGTPTGGQFAATGKQEVALVLEPTSKPSEVFPETVRRPHSIPGVHAVDDNSRENPDHQVVTTDERKLTVASSDMTSTAYQFAQEPPTTRERVDREQREFIAAFVDELDRNWTDVQAVEVDHQASMAGDLSVIRSNGRRHMLGNVYSGWSPAGLESTLSAARKVDLRDGTPWASVEDRPAFDTGFGLGPGMGTLEVRPRSIVTMDALRRISESVHQVGMTPSLQRASIPVGGVAAEVDRVARLCMAETAFNSEWPDDEDLCSECDATLDDNEGYDGLCGECADRAEEEGRWS